MGVLLPSLLDMCAFHIVTKNIDTSKISGNEAALSRIQEISDLREGNIDRIRIRESNASFPTLCFLMGIQTPEYIRDVCFAMRAVGKIRHPLIVGTLAEKLGFSVPMACVLKQLPKDIREIIISLYLFTEVEIDEERLEFLCKISKDY
ncbi:hypothetical protein ISTM_354 [Insectomime virus]|uniref:Uncharacterized protein n=1 Tax=Tunisvirus fontaine2 TaxID=1421067 RepID=V9SE29_9VIRU|nr:hypothetical protein D1R32_gp446 [Tunisvirus fontaine2]AHA46252.1 hypothetical protein ISTM_354 [Insectomime virus]AHC55163.1 hypothetical protein TNS_ORF445 [Tunisvirus fontaine2]